MDVSFKDKRKDKDKPKSLRFGQYFAMLDKGSGELTVGILAQVASNKYCIIGLDDGNRLREAVSIPELATETDHWTVTPIGKVEITIIE